MLLILPKSKDTASALLPPQAPPTPTPEGDIILAMGWRVPLREAASRNLLERERKALAQFATRETKLALVCTLEGNKGCCHSQGSCEVNRLCDRTSP